MKEVNFNEIDYIIEFTEEDDDSDLELDLSDSKEADQINIELSYREEDIEIYYGEEIQEENDNDEESKVLA